MSWFRRSPKAKEPPKHLPHHNYSPMTEKKLEEAKEHGPKKKKTVQNKQT